MLRFVHITDTHVGPQPDFTLHSINTLDATRRLVQFLNDELPFDPDFVLHSGDVTNFEDEASAKLAASEMKKLKHPIYYVAGNHDGRPFMRQHLLKQPPRDDPIHYDFTKDDFHFFVLDTRGPIDPQGHVGQDQLDWLAQTMAASQARSFGLLLHHLPLVMHVPWYDRDMRIMNADALFNVLRPHREKLRGMFFGHIHRAFTGYHQGIMCSAAASAALQFHSWPHDERASPDLKTAPGYAIVTMTHEQTTVTHHTIPVSE